MLEDNEPLDLNKMFAIQIVDHCIELHEAIQHTSIEPKRTELVKQYTEAAKYYDISIKNVIKSCYT